MKVSFLTFGCRLNQAETAILQNAFLQQGFEVVDAHQTADLVVINTCTVTQNGDADTRKAVNRICKTQPNAQIALIGCQAQTQRQELWYNSQIKWIVGSNDKLHLAKLIKNNPDPHRTVWISPIKAESFTIDGVGIDRQHTRANLKIQDGCNAFCAYCEIPYARGRARSREFDDLLREARQLCQAGHREIVLTGINLGCYAYKGNTLIDVLQALQQIEPLQRLRISSIEPTSITNNLIETIAHSPKICRFFHIPLQSGDDNILKAMNRKHNSKTFSDMIHTIHQTIPDVCLGTDVMVGFPGETVKKFETTKNLLSSLPLSYFHVFSYSDRRHSKSRLLKNKIDKNEIDRRSKILRHLGKSKRKQYLNGFLQQNVDVLFEQKKNTFWSGLTDTYIRVNTVSSDNLKNQFRKVKLKKIENQAMIGTLL